ncbi:hypothetical protein GGR54DRAFT_633408 [Hypoxylon sp. NC1633]|nr:hypothetical protein GGR54DRAFT_633408 [Hypoxylon sp. NC1633]
MPLLRTDDASSSINITHLPSYGDPSINLVSVFSPATWHPRTSPLSQKQRPPLPRPSLQVYYTAPDATNSTGLESAARILETTLLSECHQGKDPAECDRLDMYGVPFPGSGEDVVRARVEHQRREIASRVLVVLRKGQDEWVTEDGARREVGLSVVFFDAVDEEEGSAARSDIWEPKAGSVEEEEVLIRKLKAELNWQHSASHLKPSWIISTPGSMI